VRQAAHGTNAGWHTGATALSVPGRTPTTRELADEPEHRSGYPEDVRQRFLDAIYASQPFRTVLRDLGLTSNQVWGLASTDHEWSEQLEAALTATRRDDLPHGTNAAYVAGYVCRECRTHQRIRMARNRAVALK
jgi:hypothetical protein